MNSSRRYMGDGVYAEWEGDDLVLTTEMVGLGTSVNERIVIEPEVWQHLMVFANGEPVAPANDRRGK